MLSKIWYVAHIYPLSQHYAKEINKVIFSYIWFGKYEPIRRSTKKNPMEKPNIPSSIGSKYGQTFQV